MRFPVLALALLATLASVPISQAHAAQREAIFAGGCFWCMEPPYDKLEGVVSTTSGYIGGDSERPTYEQVSSGNTGHAEAVKVVYDDEVVGYDTLLDVFWHNIDPFAEGRQFCDVGSQYRSAIFPLDQHQRRLAEASKEAVETRFERDVKTRIEAKAPFWDAEEYHQNFYKKNPVRYRFYRAGCGRDDRLEAVWGDDAGKP
ncbi:peptide-methionine (S)-S-oxide reductase MsrA [Chromohalobacter sp. TMW 2.2308]|uniref:Peptide methionine sulfoxide reductase MsrA n=1 Tax=Chromohalobacter moromii TaxID=2860329 RepID=A0A9X2WZ32_9GAMM|nr:MULTISPECIES: peptide-methionine (S)-S-oxide reductase MsrA [Chromohalobacter]MCK2041830.1 peptide-methionine (S)-S-oxide reductase MsrA [Chromohalobacter moromii]MCK2044767.1 peptide-methionine (S)-S-oxide reductase MsrA [Chromohalobacter moromii]MCT8504079.1 peptide-methionine (S)-S-oxide reductase MsrA [Chromohalobacter moromii]MCT8513978.1 peptide-methionine (S)-S-oxide reductase MsrA [Chromohalobacter sp. TMW 2.2271]